MKKITASHPEMRVLKAGTCPTLTGKSTLSYHVGCNAASEIQFSVVANSSPGRFNNDWTSFDVIQKSIDSGTPVSSVALSPLFRGKSSNTAAFLMAVLKSEGLVQDSKQKKRNYERLDTKAFMADMKKLMAAKGAIVLPAAPTVTEKPKPADSKTRPVKPMPSAKPAASAKTAIRTKSAIRGTQFTATKKAAVQGKRK